MPTFMTVVVISVHIIILKLKYPSFVGDKHDGPSLPLSISIVSSGCPLLSLSSALTAAAAAVVVSVDLGIGIGSCSCSRCRTHWHGHWFSVGVVSDDVAV